MKSSEMYRLLLFLSMSWEVIHSTRGQAKDIKGVFTKGDVKFTWTPDNRENFKSESVSVYLSGNPTPWINDIDKGTYTQKDILNYTKVAIIVQTHFTEGTDSVNSDTYEAFKIPKVIKAESGEDKEIEIPLDFIPATGGYSITNEDKTVLFNVEGDSVASKDALKYIYVRKSDTKPKSITIKVKNATTEDAGYISTTSAKSNQNGPGVVLVVKGSPKKPTITGNVNVQVGEYVTLRCESKSTSAPSYYKMLPPLTYTWYRNERSEITRWTLNLWKFSVQKSHKDDSITCMSAEEINSERSEPIRLNPLYGPDTVIISPEIQDTVDIVEGKTFGPYNCSADCNPPCSRYQWKRIKSRSLFEDVGIGSILTISQVDKTHADKYRCRVDSNYKNSNGENKAIRTVTLRVLYLSEPVFYTDNGITTSPTFEENRQLNLSCKVEGVPRTLVSIFRNTNTLSTGSEWSNYTFAKGLQCEDTGNYICTGKSSQFNQTEKSFFINVCCSTRVDVASSPRFLYGSQIGHNISVTIPVISNPKPKNPAWSTPAGAVIQTNINQGPVAYRHQIESKIHITKQSDFGNYTLFVGGQPFTTITINAEGPPFKPSNFSGISEIQGQINLTWISTFNGGPEQFFLLKQKINSEWRQIENISDIGQGKQMSVVVDRTVDPGGIYEFMLQSCNRIDCSDVIKSAPIKAQEIPTYMEDTGSSSSAIAIAVSSVAVVIVIVAVLAGVLFKIKTKSQEKTPTGIPYTPPEVVYATVDKGDVNNATIKGDIPVHAKETIDTGETENMYANTNETMPIVKKSKPERPANPPKKKKKSDKKKKAEETTSTPNNTSRTVNEDGLIYIDVDFAKTPQGTQDPPVIHGEEDRTEYTFVDFSKKAPPIEDTSDDEQNEEKKDDV